MLSAITRRGIWCRPQHRHQFWLPQRRISRSSGRRTMSDVRGAAPPDV